MCNHSHKSFRIDGSRIVVRCLQVILTPSGRKCTKFPVRGRRRPGTGNVASYTTFPVIVAAACNSCLSSASVSEGALVHNQLRVGYSTLRSSGLTKTAESYVSLRPAVISVSASMSAAWSPAMSRRMPTSVDPCRFSSEPM